MKIIGKTDSGYLAEVTESDIAALLGEGWINSDGAKKALREAGVASDSYGNPKFIGATIPITTRFRRTVEIEQAHAGLASKAKNLRALADLLDVIAEPPLVPPVPTEPTT